MVGAITVLAKDRAGDGDDDGGGDMKWGVLGEGTEVEGMGVPGSFVTLAGSGEVLAVGSANVVALYAVVLGDEGGDGDGDGDQEENGANGATEEQNLDGGGGGGGGPLIGPFEICPPFPDADFPSRAGDIDIDPLLPWQDQGDDERERKSALSVASNSDASVVAVGIDSYGTEDGQEDEFRGLARVYGWSCADAAYKQLGQDLLGTEDFDGYGRSVHLSADGRALVVGADQPVPGKGGYVEVYRYDESEGTWFRVGSRIEVSDANEGEGEGGAYQVNEVGRQVQISSDGLTVALAGSVAPTPQREDGMTFVRVLDLVDGDEWTPREGGDLVGSVRYDGEVSDPRLSMSGDGSALGVVGGYDRRFLVKIYAYDSGEKNWTERVVGPSGEIQEETEMELGQEQEFEESEETNLIILGRDVALNSDGTMVTVVGVQQSMYDEGEALVRVFRKDTVAGNWTLRSDPMDAKEGYAAKSVDVSDDGSTLAVGIHVRSSEGIGGDGSYGDQGGMFVASLSTEEDVDQDGTNGPSALKWSKLGEVDGREEKDMLGSTVCVSGDGTIAMASSRKGYISFFKTVGAAE